MMSTSDHKDPNAASISQYTWHGLYGHKKTDWDFSIKFNRGVDLPLVNP